MLCYRVKSITKKAPVDRDFFKRMIFSAPILYQRFVKRLY